MKFDKLKQKWERDRLRRQENSERRQRLVREKAIPIFKKFHISKAVLFGSALENRSRPDSDIDLLVLPLSAARYWDFKRELEDALELPVDVYTDTDDKTFVRKILERGEVVHEI